ncbi:transmembrane cell adhesion receptor mua-3-like [Dreissena polymorpha]|uniref:Uncharacterized protein n=1 Tax=Dreissena polymorpha TaxID=45954 RepID=A0A9D4L2E2_DREPO|nr:transmembrane cell adhesion receptor mua-3-like [Dreissena polymorpha]KAH3850083.1 hypothetical protein DPMN_092489 [Dreissena polymorpha]
MFVQQRVYIFWNILQIIKCVHGNTCKPTNNLDIVFVVDGSGSVTADGFLATKQFMSRFVDLFEIGPLKTQIGVMVFSDNFYIPIDLNTFSSASDLKDAIFKITYPGGSTSTTKALTALGDVMLTSSRGKRSNVIPIAILITDGESDTSPVNAATRLKENGVVIYVAMVNMHDPTGDMQQVVSKPEYLMYVQNYNSLANLVGPLSVSTCDVAQGCLTTTCQNGGTCHQGQTTYRCECPSLFTGWYCDICRCGNMGSCSIDGDRWKCSCYPGYTDETCSTNIDECASSPCIHGTCFDRLNGYTCRCQPGYTGNHCETDIDECNPKPCVHGTCHDHVNAYSCKCNAGYIGIRCEIEINECESSPCQNGGTCIDKVNMFECVCSDEYYKPHCETNICQPIMTDVIFLLDSSVSQSPDQFTRQLNFVTQFIDHVIVGAENFQFAVVTFSFEAKVEIELAEFNNNVSLKEAVRNIPFRYSLKLYICI